MVNLQQGQFVHAERPRGFAKEQRAQSRDVLATRGGLYSCCSIITRRLVLAKLRAVRTGRRATHFCGPVVAQDKGRKVSQASFPKSDI